jgi:hypothetical protein
MTVSNKAYSGTYTFEGHDVKFHVLENGATMEIVETKDGKTMPVRLVDLEEGVDYQDKLIGWGYVSY